MSDEFVRGETPLPQAPETPPVETGDVQGTTTTPEVQAPVTPPVVPPAGLSRDDIAAIVSETVKGVTPQPQAPQQSPDEIRRMLNVFDPDETLVAEILEGGPKAVQAMTRLVDGITKQAVTIAQLNAERAYKPVLDRLTPLEAHHQEVQLEKLKNEFFTSNPDLKGYDVICSAVKDRLEKTGFRGTKEEAFKAVASGAREILKSLPGVQQGAGNGTPAPANKPGMSTLLQGGQGNSTQGQPKSKPNLGLAVFD